MLYQQIEQNKRNTWIVLGGFTALLLAIAGLLSVYVTFWAGMIFLAAGIIYMVYIYFYSTRHLMRITHAVEINQENVPQLYEMVEEMSLAAGIPMPKVYAIPSNIPNAFATGRDPEHASLAVTSGLVKVMNHDELLGVIGHEISHIRNYDLRVTTITSALSSFIYLAAVYLLALGWTLFKMDGGVITKCICCWRWPVYRGFANRQIAQLVYVPAAGIPGGHWFSRPDQKSEVHCRCIEKAGSY